MHQIYNRALYQLGPDVGCYAPPRLLEEALKEDLRAPGFEKWTYDIENVEGALHIRHKGVDLKMDESEKQTTKVWVIRLGANHDCSCEISLGSESEVGNSHVNLTKFFCDTEEYLLKTYRMVAFMSFGSLKIKWVFKREWAYVFASNFFVRVKLLSVSS